MTTLVLDAGALIALDRNDRAMWADLLVAAANRKSVLVPTTVIAQVWRGGPRQALLARALARCGVAPFDPLARKVGELCSRAGTSDICDAHVALVAATAGDLLYTSDPDDLRALVAVCGKRSPTIVQC